MDEAVDRALKRNKRAKRNDADNLALYDRANRILVTGKHPGLGLKLLVAEGNALFLDIHIQNDHFDLLTDGEHIRRMLHAAPSGVRHMDEAVDTADVNKRAEVGDSAHNTVDLAANDELFPLGMLLGCLFGNQNLLLGSDDALSLTIYFQNLELHGLANELVEVLNILRGNLGRRNKRADTADVRNQAALDDLFADRVEDLLFDVLLAEQLIPELLAFNIFAGEEHVTVSVVHLGDFDFDGIAFMKQVFGFHVRIAGKLTHGNHAVGLVSNVDKYFTVHNGDDGSFQNLSVMNTRHGLFKRGCKVGAVFMFRLGFFFRLTCGFGRFHSRRDFFGHLGSLGHDDFLGGSFRFNGFDRRFFLFAHYL